jgi:hypothetical protein
VRLNPESKCITAGDWASNVQEYYRNGGGIQFDFSIEEEPGVLPEWWGDLTESNVEVL